MAQYVVKRGLYSEKDKDGKVCVYKVGDVVETKSDLLRFNGPGGPKFEKVEGQPRQHAPSPTEKFVAPHAPLQAPPPVDKVKLRVQLEGMTIADLKSYADAEEVDLKGAKDKDTMIKTIMASV